MITPHRSQSDAFVFLASIVLVLGLASAARAQRAAVLTPERSELAGKAADEFASALQGSFTVLDRDLAEAAVNAVRPDAPLNMTVAQARAAASVIGSDTLILVKAETIRRTSLATAEYYEAYIAMYFVDGRSGLLTAWDLAAFEEPTAAAAEKRLLLSVASIARSAAERYKHAAATDRTRPKMEESTGDTDAPGLKPPIPYKRIKPEYPKTAYLYNVRATVEVEADVDEAGMITRTSVVRWAGYGLDDAVVEAVRAMNWRPAMLNGKPLPMRVLLRYNFTKIDKD